MSRKKSRREKAIEEKARAYYDRRIANMDRLAETIARDCIRDGEKPPVHIIALMACAVAHAQEKDVQDVAREGGAPKVILSYNTLKETEAYLDANPELSWYVDYLMHLAKARPAWAADRAVIE